MRNVHHNKHSAVNLNLPLRCDGSPHRAQFITPLPPLSRRACTSSGLPRIIINTQTRHTVQMTNPHGLGKDGNTLFICDGTAGLKVFDATNPTTISTTPVVTFFNIQATDVIPFNNKLLMIGDDGLYQYDYTNVQNISLLSKIVVEK